MFTLIAPLSDRLVGGQDPIHRPLRAQVAAFVEQRRHDLRRRAVDEAWAGEHIEDLLALGLTQRPAGRHDADPHRKRLGRHQERVPRSMFNPSSPATS